MSHEWRQVTAEELAGGASSREGASASKEHLEREPNTEHVPTDAMAGGTSGQKGAAEVRQYRQMEPNAVNAPTDVLQRLVAACPHGRWAAVALGATLLACRGCLSTARLRSGAAVLGCCSRCSD